MAMLRLIRPALLAGIVALASSAPPRAQEDDRAATTSSIEPAAPVAPPAGIPVAPPAGIVASLPAVILPESGAPDVSAVREAIGLYRRGDIAAGDRVRARLAEPGAVALLDWASVRFGGTAVDFDRLVTYLRTDPDWPGQAWMRRRAEEMLVSERKPADLVRAFFATSRPVTASGKLALAQVMRADGLPEDAAALVRDAWRTDTFGRELETRIQAEFPDVLGPADHRFRMERALFKENWDGARRAAELAGRGYDAIVRLRVAVDAKSPAAAKLIDAVPPALRSDTSVLFARAQLLRRAEKAEEAAKVVAEVPRDPDLLVDGDEWWTERRLIARKLLDSGDAAGAYAVASGHGATGAEKRIEAEFHCGWIALRFLKDQGLAARHFARAAAIAATPISIARAAYWQGRAAEAAARPDEARAFYGRAAREGTTYYGQLAGNRVGLPQVAIRPPLDPAGPERMAAARGPVAAGIGLLYAAGLRDVAMLLIVDMARTWPKVADLEAVAELSLAYRDARALLVLGKAATQRGLPLDERAFPVIGVPAFEPVPNSVDPALVHAIARQESAFDPTAQSPVGARGLMQLMPATAAATARKFGVEYEPGRLTDATYNARLGSAHLTELMENWRGSYILTFASYNAGPGNVRKWIEAYGDPRREGVDPIDWVERIPFSETRNYVQRVMENMQVYRRRLGGERSALLIESDLKRGAPAER